MANPEQPRSRFAPIPIETTISYYRKATQSAQPRTGGPNPELTPEPSPRTSSPTFRREQPRHRRRFHPQLIETSRRSRRVGDHGPATRPADKTDITPYTNHIYSAKPKHGRRKHGHPSGEDEILRHPHPYPPSQRETQQEGFNGYLLDLAAKEAERQIEEAALAAFPNSRAREGGVAHFYFREGSGSEDSPEGTPHDEDQIMPRPRRKSSNLGLNWWHKHMQEHAVLLAHDRGGDRDEDEKEGEDGQVVIEEEEEEEEEEQEEEEQDKVEQERTNSPLLHRSDSDLDKMDFDLPPDPMWTTTAKALTISDKGVSAQEKARRGDLLPHQQLDGGNDPSHAPMSHMSPERGRQLHQSPFGKPFGHVGLPTADLAMLKLQKTASPPMLGKELIFRRCPSPKLTKLETDHPFDHHVVDERCRDASGQSGLWRGYCCRTDSAGGCIVPLDVHHPPMLMTPLSPATPREPGISAVCSSNPIIEEPASLWSSDGPSEGTSHAALWSSEKRQENAEPTGLHSLHGLKEKLQREKAQAERDEKISQEFDEEFVTQVYNYLSLGYPAMAREFDEELSRISRVSVEELRRNDAKQMAKGHMLEMKLDGENGCEEDMCPRWLALRTYVVEWARQHPDLDSLDPLAWGVRERRGSWAI